MAVPRLDGNDFPARIGRRRRLVGQPLLFGVLLCVPVLPALAHHSFNMFDRTRTVTLHGTVRQLQWTNPHCFLQVLAYDTSGLKEWSIEMNSPLDMYRVGWRPGSFKAGEKVTVTFNPLRAGSLGGSLISVIDSSGRVLRTTGVLP